MKKLFLCLDGCLPSKNLIIGTLVLKIKFIEREVDIKNGNKFSGCDILIFEWIE